LPTPDHKGFFLDPPDAETLRKSKRLANPAKWRELGGLAHWVWGECRSRGATYYKTALSLPQKKTYCSCPSRKTPCAHALALAQLLDRQSHLFHQPGEAPDWVEERLATGRAGSSSAIDRQRARNRQREKRREAMQAGISQLHAWLQDLIRHGLAAAYEQPDAFWENAGTRMVDAKLGDIGRRLRAIPALLQQADWPEGLLEEIGALFLLTRAFERLDQLPENLQTDVLSLCGMQWKKVDLLEREEALSDAWQVMSVSHYTEEQLKVRRCWLLGLRTDHYALLLDFAWGNSPFEGNWSVGDWLLGELVYYPSAYPQRALIKKVEAKHPPEAFALQEAPVFREWNRLLLFFANALKVQPFLKQLPCLVQPEGVARHQNQWKLKDSAGKLLPLSGPDPNLWPVIAQSLLAPSPVFGEWDGKTFTPLSAILSMRAVALPT